MYDQALINRFIPKIRYLAKRYVNDYYDEDELFSEGMLKLLEYMSNRPDVTYDSKFVHNAYAAVKQKLDLISSKLPCEYNIVEIDTLYNTPEHKHAYNSVQLVKFLKQFLNEREFIVITAYYGIMTQKKSNKLLGKHFGVSGANIYRIRVEAERKLRKKFKQNDIDIEDLLI